MALIGVMDNGHGLQSNRVAGPIDASDQDEPAGHALPLNGHPVHLDPCSA
jgi:hypothetical protein